MKRLLYAIIVLGISPAFAMQKPAAAGKQSAAQNSLLTPTDENLSRILMSGSKEDLRKMLDDRVILSTRIFLNKLFKDKSLLQATLELQTNAGYATGKEARYEIVRLLLDRGADKKDLDEFLLPAVKAADEKLVQLLIDYSVTDKDGKAYQLATELENSAHVADVKKKKLAQIKVLLKTQAEGRKSLLMPMFKRSAQNMQQKYNTQLPVIEMDESQYRKPLPPIPQDKNGK